MEQGEKISLVEPRKQGWVGEDGVRFGFVSCTASCSLCSSAQAPLGSSSELTLLIQHKTVWLFLVGMLSGVGLWTEAESTMLGANLTYKEEKFPLSSSKQFLWLLHLKKLQSQMSEQHTDASKPREKLCCRASNNETKARKAVIKEKRVSLTNYLYFVLYT